MFLKVDTSLAADTGHKFTFANVSAGSTVWRSDAIGIDTTSHVGIATTARNEYNLYVGAPGTGNTTVVAYFDGDISVAGTIFKETIQNLDSIGIVTAQNGFRATAGGIHIQAGVATFAASIDANHNLDVDGQTNLDELNVAESASVVGGLTADQLNVSGISTFNDEITVGSGITFETNGQANFVGVVTASAFVSDSTTAAFYPPVVTTAERDAMTVTQGAMVFNSSTAKLQFYNGTSWIDATGVSIGLGMGVF